MSKKDKCGVTVAPLSGADSKLRYEVSNLQGVGARSRQEDGFTMMNALSEEQYDLNGLMFCVCDGMGGMKDGKLASDTAIRCLREFFGKMDRLGDIPTQTREAVLFASAEVERVLDGDGGSTVVMGIILHERLFFASVGDSFMYLYRNGGLFRLNAEHNICHDLYLEKIRSGSTETADCRANIEAQALSAYLGMPGLDKVDLSYKPMPLKRGDILLACSDGVGGVLDENEIMESLAWPLPQDRCSRLEQHIVEHKNPNQDNYTALIVKCV